VKKNAKQKILEAAMDVFGEQGFRAATVREICKKAGVNIALVNYHFKSKKLLYMELFNAISADIDTKYPMSRYVNPEMTKEDKLKGLIQMFVHRFFGPDGLGSSKPRLRLVNREMLEPTEVMELIILQKMADIKAVGTGIFREYLGEDLPEERINLFIISVLAQCAYPMFASEILKGAGLIRSGEPEFCKYLVDHVYHFTVSALEQMRGK